MGGKPRSHLGKRLLVGRPSVSRVGGGGGRLSVEVGGTRRHPVYCIAVCAQCLRHILVLFNNNLLIFFPPLVAVGGGLAPRRVGQGAASRPSGRPLDTAQGRGSGEVKPRGGRDERQKPRRTKRVPEAEAPHPRPLLRHLWPLIRGLLDPTGVPPNPGRAFCLRPP